VAKTRWVKDIKTGQPRALPVAFELRPKEEYLSASWLEHAGSTPDEGLHNTIKTLRQATTIPAGDKCAFALGIVDEVKETCLEYRRSIRIIHEGNSKNPSYAAVRQIGPNHLELMEKLAASSWGRLVLNEHFPDPIPEDAHSENPPAVASTETAERGAGVKEAASSED